MKAASRTASVNLSWENTPRAWSLLVVRQGEPPMAWARVAPRASDDQSCGNGDGAGAGAVAVESCQRRGRRCSAEFFRVLGDDGQGRFECLGQRYVVEGDDGDILALAAGQFGDDAQRHDVVAGEQGSGGIGQAEELGGRGLGALLVVGVDDE